MADGDATHGPVVSLGSVIRHGAQNEFDWIRLRCGLSMSNDCCWSCGIKKEVPVEPPNLSRYKSHSRYGSDR